MPPGESIPGRRAAPEGAYIENDVPQPQDEVAFGFSIVNRAPINSSEKSITAFDRKGSETLSTTTF